MKEKINKIKSFIEDYWIDILVAIVSAFVGAVLQSVAESRKMKTFEFSESYDDTENWKVYMDAVGDRIVNITINVDEFDENGEPVITKCLSHGTTKFCEEIMSRFKEEIS